MPIQTTKIEFKAKRIVFEINGGGKKGKKWYQRIQIGGWRIHRAGCDVCGTPRIGGGPTTITLHWTRPRWPVAPSR